jgi:hypothetical protein
MNKKITLHLVGNRVAPAREVELEAERILCNDVHLPHDRGSNYHNVRLWVLGNQFGAMGAVWASCEQDAIDELIDKDLAGGILIDEKDIDEEDEDVSRGGNAGEPYDSQYLWMNEVEFNPERDWKVLCMFAEARGAAHDNLDQL